MQIQISGKHIDLTDALKTHVKDKLKSLEKISQQITIINVVLTVEHGSQIAEGTAHLSGHEFNSKVESEDMYTAINDMLEKLSAQISKFKSKLIDQHHS